MRIVYQRLGGVAFAGGAAFLFSSKIPMGAWRTGSQARDAIAGLLDWLPWRASPGDFLQCVLAAPSAPAQLRSLCGMLTVTVWLAKLPLLSVQVISIV